MGWLNDTLCGVWEGIGSLWDKTTSSVAFCVTSCVAVIKTDINMCAKACCILSMFFSSLATIYFVYDACVSAFERIMVAITMPHAPFISNIVALLAITLIGYIAILIVYHLMWLCTGPLPAATLLVCGHPEEAGKFYNSITSSRQRAITY